MALPDEDFNVQAMLKKGTPRKLESALTVGAIKKTIANNPHYKVYSKETAWEHAHRHINEQMAIVKHLLTM